MKKALTLILSLMLCLCLCACGGMPGEEAALLYPDIIGEWGTDPFGEEFVLTLFKDGSCSILGTDGTWTLDDKRSNEEWVELTVKTEAMKYYVELDRVQDGMESVHLWITDTKKETTVYEGSVFTPGTQYVFPEIALHAVPELVGEWGTPYWNEESILTINEDGTCTLLRQPGRWCLESFAAVWPKIIVHIKLDTEHLDLVVKINDREYDVIMTSEQNENFLMRISEEGVNGVEILPYTEVVKSTD